MKLSWYHVQILNLTSLYSFLTLSCWPNYIWLISDSSFLRASRLISEKLAQGQRCIRNLMWACYRTLLQYLIKWAMLTCQTSDAVCTKVAIKKRWATAQIDSLCSNWCSIKWNIMWKNRLVSLITGWEEVSAVRTRHCMKCFMSATVAVFWDRKHPVM